MILRMLRNFVILLACQGACAWAADEIATAPTTGPTTAEDAQPASRPASAAPTTANTYARNFSPIAAPTTQPSPPAQSSRSLPSEFSLLRARSIFTKSRISIRGDEPVHSSTTASTTAPAARPEQSIVFDGALDTDGEMIAFLEDTIAGRMLKLRVGDSVARGKITEISLSYLDYTSNDAVIRVSIGQTLDGGEGPAVSSRAAVAAGTTAPASAPSDTGSGDDIIQRLKQKRLQELGGK